MQSNQGTRPNPYSQTNQGSAQKRKKVNRLHRLLQKKRKYNYSTLETKGAPPNNSTLQNNPLLLIKANYNSNTPTPTTTPGSQKFGTTSPNASKNQDISSTSSEIKESSTPPINDHTDTTNEVHSSPTVGHINQKMSIETSDGDQLYFVNIASELGFSDHHNDLTSRIKSSSTIGIKRSISLKHFKKWWDSNRKFIGCYTMSPSQDHLQLYENLESKVGSKDVLYVANDYVKGCFLTYKNIKVFYKHSQKNQSESSITPEPNAIIGAFVRNKR